MKKFTNVAQLLNAYVPPVVWAGLIFFLSAQSTLPGASYPLLDYIFKQGAHVFVYAVLYFLIWRAIKITTDPNHSRDKLLLIPIFVTFAYALSDEFHQSFIPGRTPALIDIGFDSIGIVISHYLTHR